MSIKDRPYMFGEGRVRPGGWLGLPRPTRAVRYLLILNLSLFVVQMILQGAGLSLATYLGLTGATFYQVWRYLTFQFLHSTGNDWIWHISLNMLGLYFLGAPLEMHWGSRRFLAYYLLCGMAAGLAYVVMDLAVYGPGSHVPLIGASGGVYAIVLACAVLFPHLRIILLFFPVPIRLAAIIIFGGMVLGVVGSLSAAALNPEFWSNVAHLGGAVAGAAYLGLRPLTRRVLPHLRLPGGGKSGAWRRRLMREQQEEQQIDDILRKIHEHGIGSLTPKERRLLQDATHHHRQRQNT